MNTIESIRRRLEQSFAEGAASAGRPEIPHPWTVATRLGRLYARLEQRWRSRRALEMLDEHGLRDIGITRVQARREAARPFWD